MSDTLFIVDASEPVFKSFVRDTYTFGSLVGATVALNTIVPPSGWINFTVAFVWLIWVIGSSAPHKLHKTPSEALHWIDNKYPADTARWLSARQIGESA